MTFKEFVDWCNCRAADGLWGFDTALYCIDVVRDVRSVPFWRRKKKWQEYEQTIVEGVVKPINAMIRDVEGVKTDDRRPD